MLDTALWISQALILMALSLNVYRMIVGPSMPDRLLASRVMVKRSSSISGYSMNVGRMRRRGLRISQDTSRLARMIHL